MIPSDLAASISHSLAQLDTILVSGNPPFTSSNWQQLFALRKHLDDQQRTLIQQTIQSDDANIEAAAGDLKTATADLTSAIAQQAKVDSIINIVSEISSAVGAVLKAL
jgi:hypothetical protein